MVSVALAIINDDEQRDKISKLYEQNKHRFYRIAFSRLENAEDAEDAVQEAFVRIADKPELIFSVAPEKRTAYVDVIVRNVATDMFNKKIRIKIVDIENIIDDIPDTEILEESVIEKIGREELLKVIEELTEHQQEVMMLHCFFGLRDAEIAHQLGISLPAAKKRLHTARMFIRKRINETRGSENERKVTL